MSADDYLSAHYLKGIKHVFFIYVSYFQVVQQKTAACLCLTTVKNEDKLEFSKFLEAIKANFNDKYKEYRKKWRGGIMGSY
ncbi:unnamed protein product [Arabidopsis lyrata]|uniref:60S ribosomal protein L7a n=1 Tax=Arabidopsis lyrata subsp. lyrata TaxID=81972 RepID=D7KSP8_ARALL|nr:hypothetical protein ARALYDRAFT_895419 [Arabidopsis lyrata subsp. lyrata]CAH8258255.1 unnamed protein product [Arabidopsis lyrata]